MDEELVDVVAVSHGGIVGAANPGAKLSVEQVREARRRIANGETQRSIAREFGVSFTAIWRVANGLKWKCVE